MTDEQLQAIRARWFTSGEHGPELMHPPTQAEMALDVAMLLVEIERLRLAVEIARDNHAITAQQWEASKAENAALREIVQAVADFDDHDGCPNCERTPQRPHASECRVTKARALLKDG